MVFDFYFDGVTVKTGNRRYHGSLSGGGGAIEDTIGLFQGVVGL